MRPSRAIIALIAVVLCACGSASHAAAVATPTKPVLSQTAEPSSPPWVAPFEAIDFLDRSRGWEVTVSQVRYQVEVSRTADGGVTWSPPARVASFSMGADGSIPRFGVRFANANDGWIFSQGLFASKDGGVTWTPTSVRSTVYDLGISGSSAWALTSMGLFRSEVGSTSWTAMPHPPLGGGGPLQLIRVNDKVAFIVQQPKFETGLFKTVDSGATWQPIAVPCNSGYGMPVATLDGVHLWMICPSEPGGGTQAKWTYISDDGGAHWTLRAYNDGVKASGSMPLNGSATLLALTSPTAGVMANNRGDVYRSIDAGRTWKETGLAYASEGFYEALQFVDPSNGWFAGLVEGVTPDGSISLYRTTDGGATWKLVSSMVGNTT